MPQTSECIRGFTESVIRRMTRIANQYGAINLSQGFPDFDPPQALLDAGVQAMRAGPHQYAVTWGAADFRQALAAKQSRMMGIDIDPDRHVVVTCGSTEAMMAAMLTVCNAGDKVIVFSPFYENYGADTILSGAEPIFVPLAPPAFHFDPAALEAAFSRNPKAIILCNPSNPSGKVFTEEELLTISRLAEKHDTFVITDEVYEHIVFAPHRHCYFASLPGMFDRTISCSSLSKTYSITGWRLGYIIAPPEIIDGARKVHDFLTVGAAAPLQAAAVSALKFPDSYYAELLDAYEKKRARFLGWLDRAGLSYYPPQGAYYVLVDIGEFIRGTDFDDTYFSEWMTRRVGVAPVPGSSFFREPVRNYIRFHFAKREETLDAAGEKLLEIRRRWAEDHA
ncbi:MAG: aminotransferase class I/II-fold pyridoxal phosphate-dependent enzyme [Candidatus Accumulibacter sp.]|jgi:aminotransferase|nr:aminotransferase class I/II-fold pyridoxal phosphate-dependent enzyme [Accumulibacter sp.]